MSNVSFFWATQSQQQQQQRGLSAAPATIKNGQVLKLGYTQKKKKRKKRKKEKKNKITFL